MICTILQLIHGHQTDPDNADLLHSGHITILSARAVAVLHRQQALSPALENTVRADDVYAVLVLKINI